MGHFTHEGFWFVVIYPLLLATADFQAGWNMFSWHDPARITYVFSHISSVSGFIPSAFAKSTSLRQRVCLTSLQVIWVTSSLGPVHAGSCRIRRLVPASSATSDITTINTSRLATGCQPREDKCMKSLILTGIVFALCVLVGSAGCGGGSGSTSVTTPPPSPQPPPGHH